MNIGKIYRFFRQVEVKREVVEFANIAIAEGRVKSFGGKNVELDSGACLDLTGVLAVEMAEEKL